jgi:multidrug efflux pump subunit AcrA (membrane-fusion protein)
MGAAETGHPTTAVGGNRWTAGGVWNVRRPRVAGSTGGSVRRGIRWWVACLALVLLALAGVGCGQGEAEAAPEKSAAPAEGKAEPAPKTKDGKPIEEEAVPVEVAELERGRIESVLRFSANLEAERQVGVHSEAKRLVRQILVEEGDSVGKGQVLLRLQDEEQRGQLAKVKSQVDKAEREYRRQKELREQELISQQVFANAIFDLEQLQLSLIDAQRELSYTDVRAPIAGTLTARKANVGDQVQIGQHLISSTSWISTRSWPGSSFRRSTSAT